MEKEVYYNGGPVSGFWNIDQKISIHTTFSAELDHDIDGRIIENAWEKTKLVYPLIDCLPENVNGELIFYKDGKKNIPIKSKRNIAPGCELAAGRGFTVTYYGRKLSLCTYHTIVDGMGTLNILNTLLYYYLSEYTGTEDVPENVCITQNREPQEYFRPMDAEKPVNYTPQAIYTPPADVRYFADDRFVRTASGRVVAAKLSISAADLMRECKKYGANPSAMLCVLFAGAIYRLHPDEQRSVYLTLTMNTRKAFGSGDSIANCALSARIPVIKEELDTLPFEELIKRTRSIISYHQTDDYAKSYLAFINSFNFVEKDRAGMVTYMGTVNLGSYTEHITDFGITAMITDCIYAAELNGRFLINFELGMATRDYIERFSAILNEMNIENTVIKEPHEVETETDRAVLGES